MAALKPILYVTPRLVSIPKVALSLAESRPSKYEGGEGKAPQGPHPTLLGVTPYRLGNLPASVKDCTSPHGAPKRLRGCVSLSFRVKRNLSHHFPQKSDATDPISEGNNQ